MHFLEWNPLNHQCDLIGLFQQNLMSNLTVWRTLVTSKYKQLIDSLTKWLTLYHVWFVVFIVLLIIFPNLHLRGWLFGDFQPGLKFQLVKRVEMSSRLNSKLLFKMTLQLHVKISTRYIELKFQLGLAKPRWKFNTEWKFQIFHIIDIFSDPGWKFDTTHVQIPCLFFKN